MRATEARELVRKHNDSRVEPDLAAIISKIKDSANRGRRETYLAKKPSEAVTKRLVMLGYSVCTCIP